MLVKALIDVFKYRDLCHMLILRDIRIRYKQAAMGFLWALFMPIVAICAGVLIKKAMSIVSGKPMESDAVVALTFKVLPWTFFVSSIRFAVQSLVGNGALITKIYFPRAVLPFSAIAACLFDFIVAALILPVLMIIFKTTPNVYYWLLPILFFFLLLYTAGVGMLLAAANLFYRDVKYVVETILMFGIFFTPVYYDVNVFGQYKYFLLLNPVGAVLESINQIIVFQQFPEWIWLIDASVASVVMFFFGFYIFLKLESQFTENI